MAALIDRVRLLVNDVSGKPDPGDGQRFTDREIQDLLDRNRLHIRYLELDPVPTYGPGTVDYVDYLSSVGDWEADAILQDGKYQTVTPASIDYQTGHVRFTTTQNPPVMITGKTYDVYGAAVDVLEAWQAKVALEFNFSADGQSFSRAQKMDQLARLADTYRKRMRPQSVHGGMTILKRSDME